MATLTRSIGVWSDGSLDIPRLQWSFRVPASGKFVRLLHDYQTALANETNPYHPRKAAVQTEVPETIHLQPYETTEFVPLTRERQEWVLQVMLLANPYLERQDAINRMHELTRTSVCFTDNGNSWDQGRADYLYGVNLDAAPMGWKKLAFGGNLVKVRSGREVEAVDYTAPLPEPAWLLANQPWKLQWATQCYWTTTGKREFIDGAWRAQYRVSRFPHMRPVGLLVPLFGAGGVTRIAESWRMEPISNGAIYSPYV